MDHTILDFIEFIKKSPTAFHAAREISERLHKHQAIELKEAEAWHLELGKKYFFSKGGCVLAFSLPQKKPSRATIIATHTDSPSFRLKPQPQWQESGVSLLRVENYGSPILHTWLDRDLVIAGRVFYLDAADAIQEKLLTLTEIPCFIPSLAIHLTDKKEEGIKINKQDHLCPILGLGDIDLTSYLEKECGAKKLLSTDLFLVPREFPACIGFQKELFAAYRIDNLSSSHSSLLSFQACKADPHDKINMALFWNHEEIGSTTEEGAQSSLLMDLLSRISFCLQLSTEELLRLKSKSLVLSVDMAHAAHPNYMNKHDQSHRPMMGKGPVIKYQATRKYATSGSSASKIMALCHKHNLPFQEFAPRSDIGSSGSTVGPIHASLSGIETIDIGAPQLAMHSSRELMASADHFSMIKLLTHCLTYL